MYYSEELVEQIRQSNDIVDVVSSYVNLKPRGNTFMGLCPFHAEKTPSFSVNRQRQIYHCFGCGAGGNVISFLMEYENLSFQEALKTLADRAGIALPVEGNSAEARREAGKKSQLLAIQKEAAKYYFYQLTGEEGAVCYRYFKGRGLTDETITRFGLGYSKTTINGLYQELKGKGFSDELLRDSGLFIFDEKRGIRDKFWNRAMFPIMDVNNRVIGFGGRVMGEGTPKYLNSPETPVFDKSKNLYGLNYAKKSRENYVLLCEGYMDVIAMHQAGFSNAVASLGTSLTTQQTVLLRRYFDQAILTYDSDDAGVRAALRAIPMLREAGFTVKVLNLKPHKDPDEFIKALGKDAFLERIKQAVGGFFFEVEILERNYQLQDPAEKTKFFREVAKKLLVFTDDLERSNYEEAVARKYGISQEALRKLVNQMGMLSMQREAPRYGASRQPREEFLYETEQAGVLPSVNRKKNDGLLQAQQLLLSWLFAKPALLEKVKDILSPEDFSDPLCRQVAERCFSQFEKEGTLNPAQIVSAFMQEEENGSFVAALQAGEWPEQEVPEQERMLTETVKRIKQASLQRQLEQTSDFALLRQLADQKRGLERLHISLAE